MFKNWEKHSTYAQYSKNVTTLAFQFLCAISNSRMFPRIVGRVLNSQTKEESESRDVEISLSPEQPHVHLNLGVEVTAVLLGAVLLLVTVLSHLANGI